MKAPFLLMYAKLWANEELSGIVRKGMIVYL
jgi:hypothetical protein